MKKPKWVIEKERSKSAAASETIWLFGIHAVRDALENPRREKLRLMLTKNAADKLAPSLGSIAPEIVDARRFNAPLDAGSVHQGAALEARPLAWGSVEELCAPKAEAARVILLDRVSDPHNVGAILRSAEVFGARAVIGTQRHAAPETGALAKSASGALERQPYLRVKNLARTMQSLRDMGYQLVGLAGEADRSISDLSHSSVPLGLVLGAEGPGLRALTRESCDYLAKIPSQGEFGSLNVSNAAAVALYAMGHG
ncbi:MAG: 23S rRNA (guanosine(2251)-2'-O)-methyltransferase RlmB [Pseudomonadota bacterium]